MAKKGNGWLAALVTLFGRNAISLFGGTLAGASGLVILAIVIMVLFEITTAPYIAIMGFLVLPMLFVLGLLLVPVGALWEKLKNRKRPLGEALEHPLLPVIDLNNFHTRRVAAVFVLITAVNLLIISIVSYQGVVFMETPEFCGKVCHTVMKPELTAYLGSPHSRVACVDCHIGPGAPWFVRSKLSGLGQVFAVLADSYERPIPAPVANLRPSRETCEQCHWPEKFTGERIKVITSFAEDETNTPMKTVLVLHIGGGNSDKGIHSWHIAPGRKTTYTTADPKRHKIAGVRVEDADGTVAEYAATGSSERTFETRAMDCIDCHNRPTHITKMPGQAMDEAMRDARIDPSLPYIKKVGVEVLTKAKGEAPDDLEQIARTVEAYYGKDYPAVYQTKRKEIDAAIGELQAIYNRNVFPDMKVTWGTYVNNIGGIEHAGCYRCHDDSHKTKDGKTIRQDCDLCHSLVASEEKDPAVLEQLGIK